MTKRKNNRGHGISKRGDSWIVEMTVKGMRYRETLGAVSRTFAKEIAAKRRTQLIEERLRPKVQDPLFEKFIDRYMAEVSVNKAERSHTRDRASVKHLKRFFSGKRVSQISRMDIERYKRDRKAEIEAKGRKSMVSVNRELALLSHAFNVAKLLNPATGVKRFEEFGRERFLTEDEEDRLFEAIEELDPELEPFFRVLINAGYRLAEVLALRNDSEMVNFRDGYIKIPRMIRKGKKKDVVTPMNDVLRKALTKAIRINSVCKGERVFPYTSSWIDKRWRRIRKKASLDNVRMHDLRHTFGSRAGKAAWDDPYAVQELMGHTNFQTTQKYVHVSEARKRTIMERLNPNTHKITHTKKVSRR